MMRGLLTSLLVLLLASQSLAEVVAPMAPTTSAPTAHAMEPAAAPTNADISKQLQKLTGKNSKESLAQVVVIGSLLGCTQKTAGKEATASFYQQMEAVGKQAETYCRAGKAEDARALMVGTFKQQQHSPVVKAALGCYDAQKQTVDAIGGPRLATDAAHYAAWLRDPTKAEKEMQPGDICRGTPKAAKAAL